ncbi:hypothetical protein M2302_006009 [Micromonospora sp. A200]|uniref:hypothetical protein n=1 Tax=Micromonospora TaxID=1873 RepID=UPI002030B866|nr:MULTISPECIES: hypothetical protein [Micromonospora]MCM0676169.1 hypothetical protein [Micromonospora phytophila]MDH6465807.1 hypothetical protein [Micromonospora sp. A200]
MIDVDEAIQIATDFLARRRSELGDQRELPRVQEVTTGRVQTADGGRLCHIVSFGWPIRIGVDQETGSADMLR